MKKKIVKSLALVMSLTCLCVGFGGCAVKDKMDGWFDKVFAETPSTEDSVDEENKNSSTEDKDDSTNKDDTSTDTSTDEGGEDFTDTSTDKGGEDFTDTSTDSSTDDESGDDTTQDGVNGEGSTVTDFPFFVGDGNAFEDDYVYIMPEKGTCYVGDTFRIRAEAIDGIAPIFTYYQGSDDFVTVDERGNVTALAAGKAYIGVHFDQKSYIVELTVLEAE